MLCLGIESSCDETALALVRTSDAAGKGGLARNSELVAEVVRTQADMHALFGGVVPELASREHYRCMGPLYDSLLRKAAEKGMRPGENAIGCVAVARGPGLLGSLLVGVSFAKALAFGLGVPVIGVNHLHAHLLAAGLEQPLSFLPGFSGASFSSADLPAASLPAAAFNPDPAALPVTPSPVTPSPAAPLPGADLSGASLPAAAPFRDAASLPSSRAASLLPGPALGLLASGGHTHLYLINGPADFQLLGRSIDDAAGEAFDKFGKAMGFAYPAGQRIDALAARGNVNPKLFPRPYLDNDNLDFSFSGLKTAAMLWMNAHREAVGQCDALISGKLAELAARPLAGPEQMLADACASFNYAVAQTLKVKTARALARCLAQGAPVRQLVLAGGVAANQAVRKAMRELAEENGLPLAVPGPALCTDNAAMIAYAGQLLFEAGLRHGTDFPTIPRGQVVPFDYQRVL